MAHTLSARRRERDLDTAFFADHTPVLEAFVLATQALVIFQWSKQFGAEKAVALRLEGAVVDGLGLFHLTEGP